MLYIQEYRQTKSGFRTKTAIDMSNFNELDEQAKKEILNFFKGKYKVEVMNATFGELKEKGFYNPDTTALNGVLLRIEKVEFKSKNNIFFECSKYRSGLGAVGVEVIVHYKDGNWKVRESNVTRIS
ncbi:peptide ABC transporter substrate-binding protein [Desulfolucanica intricata]|uniref:peptide ABC transporter substrate-binding protein n=1 Tax=Desulfolucanica intricata TaxID=1285191 RepID=UPI000A81CC35|nr:peptide ABC transporter substrate-binding protein [Desulfolucanica intricata]